LKQKIKAQAMIFHWLGCSEYMKKDTLLKNKKVRSHKDMGCAQQTWVGIVDANHLERVI